MKTIDLIVSFFNITPLQLAHWHISTLVNYFNPLFFIKASGLGFAPLN